MLCKSAPEYGSFLCFVATSKLHIVDHKYDEVSVVLFAGFPHPSVWLGKWWKCVIITYLLDQELNSLPGDRALLLKRIQTSWQKPARRNTRYKEFTLSFSCIENQRIKPKCYFKRYRDQGCISSTEKHSCSKGYFPQWIDYTRGLEFL